MTLLRILADLVCALEMSSGREPRPASPTDAAILAGDVAQFLEDGEQLFVDHGDATMYLVCTRARLASVLVTLRTGILAADALDLAWAETINFVRAAVARVAPALVQVNGFADGPTRGFARIDELGSGARPAFLAPFTYVGDGMLDAADLRRLEDGGITTRRLASGWSLQVVEQLADPPPPAAVRAASRVFEGGYVQIAARR